MKWILGILAALALLVVGLFTVPLYKEPPIDPAWSVEGSQTIPAGAVTARFPGTSTLLFTDGSSNIMIDGWFSRPTPFALAFGKIEPNLDAITYGLAANNVSTLDVVIPVHSHYDHAMDSPEVAKRTGAVLLGSESTANIGRGWGLAESQIQVFEHRVPVQIGNFTITAFESRHFEFPDPTMREQALGNPAITEPLVPPAGAFDYRVGKAYVLHFAHPQGSFAVVGSAGFIEGDLQGVQADMVFLGVGGLGSQTDTYRETYWAETVDTLAPHTVIPIHFDGLTAPITGPWRGPSLLMAMLSSGSENTLSFLQGKAAAAGAPAFKILPRYDAVVLFD
ncbi:MAG: MBL fold metallo-hydrolase [Halioglobus sp.]|nr:MBL fold metallo-hydrolase [Halioglobus sp.]